MGRLLQVLRGEAAVMEQWQDVFALAEQECVLPLLVARLRESGQLPAGELQARCAEVEHATALSSFWWTSELKDVLGGFARESVQVVLLKGPSLALRIYGNVGLRVCRDLDLLVRREDLKAAGKVLRQLGFAANRRPDDYHQGWVRGSTMVELHVDVENALALDFGVKAAWGRMQPIEFGVQPAWVLGPADELLFLCLHGVRHRYERLSHVMDVALSFRRLAPQIDAAAFRSGAPQKLRNLLVLGHVMACHIDAGVALPEGFVVDARVRAQVETIAERLWASLMERPGVVLDWRAQHRFYLELEPSRFRRTIAYVRHLYILTTRLIEEDFAYAERYGIRNVGMVWILRQWRLLQMRRRAQ